MKNTLLLSAIVGSSLLFTVAGCDADVVTVSGAPSLSFAQTEHDFGEVKSGDTLVHRFAFVNAGDQPLELGTPRGS